MKNALLVLILCVHFFKISAQNHTSPSAVIIDSIKVKKGYFAARDSILQTYCCDKDSCTSQTVQMVLPNTLDSSFSKIFNTVILSSNNIVNNGSAGSLTQDEKTGKVSANYSHKINYNHFANVGFSAESSEGVWNLYTKDSWQNTINLNLGFTFVPKINGQYFFPSDCNDLATKRRQFMDSLLIEYFATLNTSIKTVSDRIDTLKLKLASDYKTLDTLSKQKSLYKELTTELDSLSKIKVSYQTLTKGFPYVEYRKILQKHVTDFELRSDKFTGYNLFWINTGFSFGNTQNKLYNDTLTRDSLITFNVSDYARFRLFGNANYVMNSESKLFFANFTLSLFNTNFLEKKKLKDIPYITKDSTGTKYIFSSDKSGDTLGVLDNLKKNIWLINPSIYSAYFFMFKKTFGLEGSFDYKLKIKEVEGVDYPNSYTAYAGAIFRLDGKEDLSKATIAVDFGFFDTPVNEKAKDYFSVRLKIGVPFNIIAKAK